MFIILWCFNIVCSLVIRANLTTQIVHIFYMNMKIRILILASPAVPFLATLVQLEETDAEILPGALTLY